jgi:protein-disulfide isomerase
LVVLAFGIGLGTGYFVWSQPLQQRAVAAEQKLADLEKNAAAAETNTQQQAQQVKRYDIPIDGNPVLGSDKAAITLVEFSDYECPFCRRWHAEVLPKIQEKYGDKIRLVYRDFPLSSIHANAIPAAEAADCAGEQKHYWEFNNQVFATEDPLGNSTYEAIAKNIGLDVNSFKKCVDERRYQKEVENDLNFATQLGVRSTPTFFINGLAVVGAQPFEVFEQIIDLELAGKIPQQ